MPSDSLCQYSVRRPITQIIEANDVSISPAAIANCNTNYLTITQDPYPPLNNSPEFFDYSSNFSNNDMNGESAPSIIFDCIEMNEFDIPAFERGVDNIKKE